MVVQSHIFNLAHVIELLLDYLPHAKSNEDQERIMYEIVRMRKEIRNLEDLSKTEKMMEAKFLEVTVESKMNL